MTWITIITVLICAMVLAWNFYTPFREQMRGWSTIVEGTLGVGMTYYGMFADAIREGQEAGYIPENLIQYVPFVVLSWIVIKRFQTKTPVGKR